jgi:putative endonuclease
MLPAIEYENNGKKAENIATKFLQKSGHKIITRNFRTPEGEIDIISLYDNFIVASEIKQRSDGNFKYITQKQMERIWYTFEIFLEQNQKYSEMEPMMQLVLVQNNNAQILEII